MTPEEYTSPASAVKTGSGQTEPAAASALHVVLLTLVVGFTEIVGFLDIGQIFPGIMTGNTVQLGASFAEGHWARFSLLAFAILLFFVGCMLASAIKRTMRHPLKEYLLMALLLALASIAREYTNAGSIWRYLLEMPLLAFAIGIQGETLTKFGGVSLQSIVVTNNMTKFADAFVARCLLRRACEARGDKIPSFSEMLLPGLSWVSYCTAACLGAWCAFHFHHPLLIPAALLLVITILFRRELGRASH